MDYLGIVIWNPFGEVLLKTQRFSLSWLNHCANLFFPLHLTLVWWFKLCVNWICMLIDTLKTLVYEVFLKFYMRKEKK